MMGEADLAGGQAGRAEEGEAGRGGKPGHASGGAAAHGVGAAPPPRGEAGQAGGAGPPLLAMLDRTGATPVARQSSRHSPSPHPRWGGQRGHWGWQDSSSQPKPTGRTQQAGRGPMLRGSLPWTMQPPGPDSPPSAALGRGAASRASRSNLTWWVLRSLVAGWRWACAWMPHAPAVLFVNLSLPGGAVPGRVPLPL
jgi:hypothetical protein